MRNQLLYLRDWCLAYLTGIAVLTYIAADIGRSGNWPWPSFAELIGPLYSRGEKVRVVRDYSEFTRVSHGSLDIITGIRFVSSQGEIATQWCYLERSALKAGEPELKLSLADAKGSAAPVARTITSAQAHAFDLTPAAALQLVSSHCRFKNS